MAKNSIRQYDPTAANNLDLAAISLVEGVTKPSDVNNLFRAEMAQQAQYLAEMSFPTVGGTANALTLTPTTALAALADGVVYSGTIGAAPNTTINPTLNISAIGAKVIRKMAGGVDVALAAGDLAALTQYEFVYKSAANSGGGAWVVMPTNGFPSRSGRNRLVNPAFQISQENGNTAVTATTKFAADQWQLFFTASTAAVSLQRVQSSLSLHGSQNKLEFKCTTAKASLGTSDYVAITQNIEGNELADLAWGTASAKQLVDSFTFKGPAGVYHVHYSNSAANRHYAAPFTISAGNANTEVQVTLAIPGDTSGTWLTDTGLGLTRDIILAAGSSLQGTASAWTGSTVYAASGQFNILSANTNVVQIADCQLTADPDAIGTAPLFETPEYGQVLRDCQRFYEVCGQGWLGRATSATAVNVSGVYKTTKRVGAALTLSTTTPIVAEIGVADRTGSGSTVSQGALGVNATSLAAFGFSSMTSPNMVVFKDDYFIAGSRY